MLRYLKIRPSAGANDFQQDIDAVELWGSDGSHVHDIVIDHCSLEWAMDENMSAWVRVTDVTVQRSLLAEARVEGQDQQHAKGLLVGAESSDAKADRFSFHHDVFAHNPDRNPRVAYATTDFRNNLIYDWGGNNSTLFGPYGGFPPGRARRAASAFRRRPAIVARPPRAPSSSMRAGGRSVGSGRTAKPRPCRNSAIR